ncbi:MAG TPA: MFS transporter [Candidatus Limnocylindrales bacterium]|nr:MFS transporter [Candidatus Limnocylindrales bacterium]
MINPAPAKATTSLGAIKALTFLMFMMFAMTTDSVGIIIPEIIKQFHLSMTAAGAFQYATMGGIALAGFFLGFLADRLGRKATIIIGLAAFAVDSYLFTAGNSFAFFVGLLAISGVSIGVFKTGALALIGDIVHSTTEHTAIMNTVEGFFGVGSILGPAILSRLLGAGVSWKFLYVIAGTMCALLVVIALSAKYPHTMKRGEEPVNFRATLAMIKNPYALGFSMGEFLYVATECAIYVWMPTLLAGRTGFFAVYSISIFFLLRCGGRFVGGWMLGRYSWTAVLTVFSAAILLCFVGAVVGGAGSAVYLLPLSGLFMSVIYPTINSKGISCFPKSEHGAVSGVILFFTCVSAAVGPLAMGAVSDALGGPQYGFILATAFSALLFAGCLLNSLYQPTRERLRLLDRTQYEGA